MPYVFLRQAESHIRVKMSLPFSNLSITETQQAAKSGHKTEYRKAIQPPKNNIFKDLVCVIILKQLFYLLRSLQYLNTKMSPMDAT